MGKFKVNGQKVKVHHLSHKDRIEIGNSTFRYMENE
jgi:pSer/pThr/pTyr-binding forkhead associated (FHA) protein